ncbi:MAG: N-methyl-L-tryptophan oxidase [candidate division Zixibacteria bacterium]|nr:N-methyl-L-tryptophan oxidase [candidate division Zixibacteria bacterium]
MNRPSASYDVIVIGVGGMGSASAWHLARRGCRVLGLEQFNIPHDQGSSHGQTRIIRLAYSEHPSYVPLLRRAYALWCEIEERAGERLLHITGALDAGPADDWVFQGSKTSCEEHGLPHEILTGAEVNRRFPGYRLPEDIMAVFQTDGGYLLPERCIVAHVEAAQEAGAEIRACEPVVNWKSNGRCVTVETSKSTYTADRLVITAGGWIGKVVNLLDRVVQPERQVLGWFQPRRRDLFLPDRFPVFNLHVAEGRYYGLPVHGVPGFKIGRYHHLEERADMDAIDRSTHPRDEAVLREFAERYFPDGSGPTMSLQVCAFTNTADGHFILDAHPEYPNVYVASPCSGHGFKFCSVIGEVMADLATTGKTSHDIALHGLARLNS